MRVKKKVCFRSKRTNSTKSLRRIPKKIALYYRFRYMKKTSIKGKKIVRFRSKRTNSTKNLRCIPKKIALYYRFRKSTTLVSQPTC